MFFSFVEKKVLLPKGSSLLCALCAGLLLLVADSGGAQITLSYGSLNTNSNGSPPEGQDDDQASTRSYIALGYDMPLSNSLTLTPSFGVLNEQLSPVTTITDPTGYTLGLWGQYDLLAYNAGNAYAQGGLTYLDYEKIPLSSEDEFQFALGVGADMELGERVSAFTNVNYTFSGESSTDLLDFASPETDLEIGIEIKF